MVLTDNKGNAILPESKDNGKMRTFGSGAVRDTSVDKLDYEACLSPLVLKRYAEYVKSCRVQPDGKIRADDNWQKGFGLSVWMKSKFRHLITTWRCYRDPSYGDIEVSLCAEFFNTHGMLHEILASKTKNVKDDDKKYILDMWHCKKHGTTGSPGTPCWQCETENMVTGEQDDKN